MVDGVVNGVVDGLSYVISDKSWNHGGGYHNAGDGAGSGHVAGLHVCDGIWRRRGGGH
jgi:hypothetical protein